MNKMAEKHYLEKYEKKKKKGVGPVLTSALIGFGAYKLIQAALPKRPKELKAVSDIFASIASGVVTSTVYNFLENRA